MSATAEQVRKQTTSQVSEQEARQVAEAARETEWSMPSFVRELFLGRLRMDLIDPLPAPDPEEQKRAQAFLRKVEQFLDTVDSQAIEREAKVPDHVLQGLREIGAFGIKIPLEYGGLGLSQASYNRAIGAISTRVSA